jgi:hypothetical protein
MISCSHDTPWRGSRYTLSRDDAGRSVLRDARQPTEVPGQAVERANRALVHAHREHRVPVRSGGTLDGADASVDLLEHLTKVGQVAMQVIDGCLSR